MIRVEDPADPRLADFRDLNNADRRPDRPGGTGLVIAEGVPVVRRLLASPYPIRAVMGVADRVRELHAELPDVPAYVVAFPTMDAVVGFHLNRGVLASADRARAPDLATVLAEARRVVVLEGVNDHENLGAIFRNAAALGGDAVLLTDRCADPLYRRSVRVSMGHVLRVPFLTVKPVLRAIAALHERGFAVAALTPGSPSMPLCRVDRAGRLALMVGAEGPGLSRRALAGADLRVRIPMPPGVDSLNVATAAAIALYALR